MHPSTFATLGQMEPMKVPISGHLGESSSTLHDEFVALQRSFEQLAYQNSVLARENAMMRNAQLSEENLLFYEKSLNFEHSMMAGLQTAPMNAWSMRKGASDDASTSVASIGNEQKAEDESSTTSAETTGELFTTVMMRNLPNNMTRDMLLTLVDSQGFKGCYDFVYLPTDFRSKARAGLGYSFINFEDPATALRFHDHFSGFSDWSFQSEKVCTTMWSTALQGRDAHVERYKNSPVMHESLPDEAKPLLFKDGERLPFPAPTKRIRPPHHRASKC